MRFIATLLTLAGALLSPALQAQKIPKEYKFEKIDAALLRRTAYAVDSNASAVVIADVGRTSIEGNSKGWCSFVFQRHRRVHILKKSGYDEATFEIPLYHQSFVHEEQLETVKAVSYNLENG